MRDKAVKCVPCLHEHAFDSQRTSDGEPGDGSAAHIRMPETSPEEYVYINRTKSPQGCICARNILYLMTYIVSLYGRGHAGGIFTLF